MLKEESLYDLLKRILGNAVLQFDAADDRTTVSVGNDSGVTTDDPKDDPERLKMLVARKPTTTNVDFQELLLILLQKQYELSKSEKEAIAKGYLLDPRLLDLETEFFGFGAFREGFWALVKVHIGFVRKRDGDVLEQLALSLIKDYFRKQSGMRARMPRRAHAFIEVWRNHPTYRTSFRYWAEEIAPEMKGETLMISAKDTVAKQGETAGSSGKTGKDAKSG